MPTIAVLRDGCVAFAASLPNTWLDGYIVKKNREQKAPYFLFGAAEESRTLDLNLGKVALYQLSYCRKNLEARAGVEPTYTDLQSGA